MPTGLSGLPKFLVIDPQSTLRLEMELDRPSCEIDLELENPGAGRSFVVMIGQRGGPFVQRLRLSGKARILFEPRTPGVYELVLANPASEPVVLRLRGRQRSSPLARDGLPHSGRSPLRHRARRTGGAGAPRPARRVARTGRATAGRSVQSSP